MMLAKIGFDTAPRTSPLFYEGVTKKLYVQKVLLVFASLYTAKICALCIDRSRSARISRRARGSFGNTYRRLPFHLPCTPFFWLQPLNRRRLHRPGACLQ